MLAAAHELKQPITLTAALRIISIFFTYLVYSFNFSQCNFFQIISTCVCLHVCVLVCVTQGASMGMEAEVGERALMALQ